MSTAAQERAQAAQLHEDDVVGILLTQHARMRDLFAEVLGQSGLRRKQAFDELRALLAVHETAEEMIVRPVSKETAGLMVADARNREEKDANEQLAELEKLDVDSADFSVRIARLEQAVSDHSDHEEREEFPSLLSARREDQRITMGKRLRWAEKTAPTHAHPATAGSPVAQWTAGPFASLVDRVRDVVRSDRRP